ncbi:MAG: hypothetical protein WAN36_04515, partial [Calditrichia bacterium]
YMRLQYLKSDISKENERYLMNFQYLNGLISKPRKSMVQKFLPKISFQYFFAILFTIILILCVLFFIKKITFYLLLNTIVILLAVIFAVFYSFSSIKRDWQNQFGFFLKKEKKLN